MPSLTAEPNAHANHTPPPQDQIIRRTDATLRGRYPHLTTEIFEVSPYEFRIIFDAALEDAGAIQPIFDHEIRPVTTQVRLSNQRPDNPIRQLRLMTDAEASSELAGLPPHQPTPKPGHRINAAAPPLAKARWLRDPGWATSQK